MPVSNGRFGRINAIRERFSAWLVPFGEYICKALAVAGLMFFLINILLSKQLCASCTKFYSSLVFKPQHGLDQYSPTNISHLVFAIGGSSKAWKLRRPYIEAWWRPNMTRGLLWLDRDPVEHLPWSASCPPYRVSEDVRRFEDHNKHAVLHVHAIRMVHTILETYMEVNNTGARWYVMADDDTFFIVDNLVEVLAKYDHSKYFYIGENSESVGSNDIFSFNMAYGGAGYALSFPVVEVLARNINACLQRYSSFYSSDQILHACVSDLGVALTRERGFHQIDLHGDVSGILSAHPPVPFVSLHHLDHVDPIFPAMNRHQSLNHLIKPINIDPSRLFQQTICYHKQSNWSFSVSWGYSAQIYEQIHPPSFLERPLQTFSPWKPAKPSFMFKTRLVSKDPCEMPHTFFFDSVEQADGSLIVISYLRSSPRKLPPCLSSGNHSADEIMKIRVFSPTRRLNWNGRRECCDVEGIFVKNITEVKIRGCMKDEIVL